MTLPSSDASPFFEHPAISIYIPPEPFEFESTAGHTVYGHVYRPPGVSAVDARRFPTILFVYGGPHVQMVTNEFKAIRNIKLSLYTRLGFVVVVMDCRGSARRGLVCQKLPSLRAPPKSTTLPVIVVFFNSPNFHCEYFLCRDPGFARSGRRKHFIFVVLLTDSRVRRPTRTVDICAQAFEGHLKNRMGTVEIADQVCALPYQTSHALPRVWVIAPKCQVN